jgi:hypothetical protein
MVICPGYTVSGIIPVDQHDLAALLYRDEWIDEFYRERGKHEPPQK